VRSVNLFTIKEKKMKKKLFALSGVFLIVLVLAGLWATKATDLFDVQQVEPAATSLVSGMMSMEQMSQGASAIVIGQCTGTRSQWVGRSLVTLATISISESLKGAAAGNLTVAIPGGVDANRKFPVAMTYAGAPQISTDEEVFLFLTGPVEGANDYSVMGFAQGKFSINQANGGEPVVMRDMIKTQVQRGPGAIRGNLQSVPLAEFKALVMSYLNK
jgi:hypothetical protein